MSDTTQMIENVPPAPAGEPRRRSRGWLWAVLGVLVLALAAMAVWFLLVRPASAGASGQAAVVDIEERPEEAWTYSYAPRGEEEWVSSSISHRDLGGGRVAVVTTLDLTHYHENVDSRWYPGYDEHYEAGKQAGADFGEAVQTYYDEWDAEYPDINEYFLDGQDYETSMSDPAFQGWFDGFQVGQEGSSDDYNRAVQPDPVPTTGQIAALDMGSGEPVWTVELSSLGVETAGPTVSLHGVTPEGHLPVAVHPGNETDPLVLFSLDPADGSVVSEVDLYDTVLVPSYETGSPLVELSEGGVARRDTADLSSTLWRATIGEGGSGYLSADGDYVHVDLMEGGWWLDTETGFEPAWFDSDPELGHRVLDDVVLQLEPSSFGTYVDAVDHDGEVLWSGDADELITTDGAGGQAVFTAERDPESGSFEYLMRIDPRTGEPMWEREYDEPFSHMDGTVKGALVLDEGDRSAVVDLATGERSQRLRGSASLLGTDVVYGADEDRLRAWSVEDGRELWVHRLSDGQTTTAMDGQLLVHDSTRRSLTKLQ